MFINDTINTEIITSNSQTQTLLQVYLLTTLAPFNFFLSSSGDTAVTAAPKTTQNIDFTV